MRTPDNPHFVQGLYVLFFRFFCFKFSKVLKQIMFYGANGLWSGATSISDGIFFKVLLGGQGLLQEAKLQLQARVELVL